MSSIPSQPGIKVFAGLLVLAAFSPSAIGSGRDTPPDSLDDIVREYCLGISDKAVEARAAWLTNETKKLQNDVSAKIAELEKRTAELKIWVERRQTLLRQANESLVEIYSGMDPEAAAAQLAQIDFATGASILRQLKPRGASAILDVMPPEKAAPLVKMISAAGRDENATKGN